MPAPSIVLASTSPFRRELLARLRIPFETAAPRFEEPVPPPGPVAPERVRALALANARGKAESLREWHPRALLIASDQMAECEGRVFSKPGTEDRAVGQLLLLQGREHRLHTAVVVLDAATGRREEEVVTSRLRMRDLGEDRLRHYVRVERPLACAGSYRSEGLGIALFEELGGPDPTAIVGLPLTTVVRLCERFGLDLLGEAR